MRTYSWVLLGCLGIVLLLFALPATRWMVKNDVDFFVQGRFPDSGRSSPYVFLEDPLMPYFGDGVVQPKPVSQVTTYNDVIRETCRTEHLASETEFDNLCYIRAYCEAHPKDSKARAYYCKLLSRFVSVWKPDPLNVPDPKTIQKKQARSRELLKVTDDVDALDPNNAFYALLRSGAYINLGDKENAQEELIKASQEKRLEAYPFNESDVYQADYERRYGYRGNYVRALNRGVDTGYVNTIKTIFDWAQRQNDEELLVAMLRISEQILVQDQTLHGVLNVHPLICRALSIKKRADQKTGLLSQYTERAAQVQPTIQKAGFDIGLLSEYEKSYFDKPFQDFTALETPLANVNPRAFVQESAPSLVFAWLIFLPAIFLVSWLVSLKYKSDRLALASPHLVWLLALYFDPGTMNWVASSFALLFLVAVLFGDRVATIVRFVGFGLAIVVAIAAFFGWLDGVWYALAYVIAGLLSIWKPQRIGSAIIGVLLSLIVVGCLYFFAINRIEDWLTGYGFNALIGGVILYAFIPRTERLPKWIPVATMILLFVGYLGTVAWRYQDDKALAAELPRLKQGGDLMREYYGIR